MPKELTLFQEQAPLSIPDLLLNLGIGVVLAVLLRWHFRRFGSTLSNREEFSQVFPMILLTTVLIITVVKSSLALSLGLVGALSIVRFRTPIKEPEELAYLFIAIAMGLGLGANQRVPTVVAGVVILVVTTVLIRVRRDKPTQNLYLSLDLPATASTVIDSLAEQLNGIIAKHVAGSDLRRFDVADDAVEATYFVDLKDADALAALAAELREAFPGVGVTFIDQNRMPSV